MIPMMLSLIVSSTLSGFLVSKTGHYKSFPIIGTIFLSIGLGLLSLLGINSNQGEKIGFLLLMGIGVGLVLQVIFVY